ncbi:energy transducer TonB, partial [Mesorhizobium sp. M4A.F.Ca.ET.050.02.1.1]
MTGATAALSGVGQPRFGASETGLWAAAAALILVAHVAVAYAVQNFSPADISGGPPPALAIEMSPLAPAEQEEALVPDTVTPDQAEPVEETERAAPVKPATEPAPEQVTEVAEPTVEQPAEADAAEPAAPTVAALSAQQPLDEVVPDVVETVAPDVVIPLPQPKPVDAPAESKV